MKLVVPAGKLIALYGGEMSLFPSGMLTESKYAYRTTEDVTALGALGANVMSGVNAVPSIVARHA